MKQTYILVKNEGPNATVSTDGESKMAELKPVKEMGRRVGLTLAGRLCTDTVGLHQDIL